MPSCPNPSRVQRRRLAPAALALVAVAAAAHAAPRAAAQGTAVVERIDLEATATGARFEITLDRPLTWSVGRDRDGALALDLPQARPGHGVVSRVLPGGLVAELRIASVGIPSRPVTRLAIVTRGAADHRVAVDGRRLVVELVPSGSPFPDAPTASPLPADGAPPPAMPLAPFAPAPQIESEDLEEPELAPPPAAEAAVSGPERPAELPSAVTPRELYPGDVASLPAPSPAVALAPAPAAAAPPVRVVPPAIETAPVPQLATGSGVAEPQPLAPAVAPPIRVLPPAIAATAVDPLAGEPGATKPELLAPVASPPVRILPPPLAAASVDALEPPAAVEIAPSPLPPGASAPVRIEIVEPPPPPLAATPVETLPTSPEMPGELPAAAAELRFLPPPALREVATRLTAVARLAPDVLAVAGNGAFEFTGLRLENPERFVIDLHGVVNQTGLGVLDIDDGVVVRVRVSQFRSSPVPVTRIIFDLVAPAVPAIEPAADGLLVRFPAVAPRSIAAPPR